MAAMGRSTAQALSCVADEADMCLRRPEEVHASWPPPGPAVAHRPRGRGTELGVTWRGVTALRRGREKPAPTRRWRSREVWRPERDAGFSLIEPIVAALIVTVVVLAVVNLLVHAAETVSASRQRQAAAALATQALEQLRGLPYDTVASGLRNDDLAGDPDISVASGVPRLVLSGADTGGTGVDEPLVVNYGTTTPAPLYPHRAVVANSTFRRNPTLSVFVTLDPSTSGVYDLTAVVRWTPADGRSRTFVQRSKLFSPLGSGGA
jgi:type II secretory pathway pseudopilin PulG